MTTVSPDKDEVERLRETIVELWHDTTSEHGPLHQCLGMTWEQYQQWNANLGIAAMSAVNSDLSELVEKVARFIEPDIMAHSSKDWEWRQEQERKYARRLLDETGISAAMSPVDRLREALTSISSQAICYGMKAEEAELRDWLRFISETAEAALSSPEPVGEVGE